MKTSLCDLLSIKYPIISGGMIWCSGWELASAVSNEGGLGLIGAGSMSPDILREHIKKTKIATQSSNEKNVFGVNLPLMNKDIENNIQVVIEEKVPVVFTSAGNPSIYTPKLKDAGIKVVHVISNEKFAIKAQEACVDAIVAEGFEAGGHNGKEETTTLVLVKQIVDKVDIPVIAAGGIASGEQIAATFCLGAKGVQIGTLFAISKESSAHINFKKAVLASKEGYTKLFFRKLSPTRLLNVVAKDISQTFFSQVEEAENRGATKEELLNLIGVGRSKKGIFEGDLQNGELEIGQAASMLNEIQSVKQIFVELKAGFDRAIQKIS
ncbi:MAG: nitronate monooxygenase [Bacteroidales bacterium]|jgi:enoyl-[acyl-carrier protein] reductase II|nr:nitronate monooxygenase [Bacteroidales bacterium]